MSLTSNFAFQNKDAMTATITPVDLKPVTNYAKVEDEPTSCVLTNKTTPLDQGETLAYRCQPVSKVSTSLVIQNPSKVTNGIQYVIKLDEILRTTNDAGEIICDEPVVAYLTIRHQASGNITNALIGTVVTRLLGACMREDGTFRFDDLMRSALVPTAN